MKKKVRLPIHIKPERYKITLKPDLNEFTFTGEETIFLSLEKSAKQITLHAVELEIESAEFIHENQDTWAGHVHEKALNLAGHVHEKALNVAGKISYNLNAMKVSSLSYDKKSETATFSFPGNIPKGKGQLKLIFKGILNDKMRGFYRSKYEVGGQVKHLATTQFESTDARRAFPCFDEPAHKAVFDVTMVVPKGTKAISNTIESVVSEHESGYQVIEFAPTPKMSTYLLAFIVGEFEYLEGESMKGKGVRVFTTEGKKEQAKFALDVAIKCLDFYENYFGIDYPLPVLDLIAIPDFASGAMENWGAVTYRESTLLIDEERSSTANKQWVALVIAHELAHQWFGNLVTMEWWTHLWLNEGFASFVEYLAIDHIFPDWDIWTQFVATEMGDAFSLDCLKNTHPIEVEVGHPAEISEIFDKVSYSKGASVLRMLWQYLGEKDFQKGLRHYLKKHAYGNAQTEDLWSSLEEVSGKPVAKVMRNWTLQSGHPVVRVRGKGKGERGKLELTQSRFFSSPISRKKTEDNTIWNIPLKVGKEQYLMNKKTMFIPNSWEKLNASEASLVRVDYPRDYLRKLEDSIKSGKLSAPDRLGLIRDSFDLAQSGDSPTTLALELTLNYEDEEDYTVWAQLSGHISQLDSLLASEDFYEEFKSYGRKIYGGIAPKMGWEAKIGEKHTDGLLRGMVLYKLGHFGDKDIIKKTQGFFGKNIEPDLRGVVYNLVAENGGLKEFNILVKMYKAEDNQQEKDRIGRALGLFPSEQILEKSLDFSVSKYVRSQNTLGIIASVWGNPQGRYPAWEFVKKNWKFLKERYAGGHYFTRVFGPAGDFTKIADAKEIKRFVVKNPVPEAKRTIAQVLEQIYSNASWLKRDRTEIRKFLNSGY